MRTPHDPHFTAIDKNGRGFWHRDSEYQSSGYWLRHSRAIDRLGQPSEVESAIRDRGVTCGPVAFAAITGMSATVAADFFEDSRQRPWTTRTDMERALNAAAVDHDRHAARWPDAGLALLQFTGPWTRRNFAQAALKHTHWIAVLGEYIYDINWRGWLPRRNWEEVVLDELLILTPRADGWYVMTSYELSVAATFGRC